MSKEFSDIKLRTTERSMLNKLNNDGKFPKNKDQALALDQNPNLIITAPSC